MPNRRSFKNGSAVGFSIRFSSLRVTSFCRAEQHPVSKTVDTRPRDLPTLRLVWPSCRPTNNAPRVWHLDVPLAHGPNALS